MIKPFVINSNICIKHEDISSYANFFDAVAGNTGNSYITYSLLKETVDSAESFSSLPQIPSLYTYDWQNADKDISIINDRCSHVFLVLQDQLRIAESYGLQLPYDNIINFLKKVKRPILVAGLGANALNGYETRFHERLSWKLVAFIKDLSWLVKNIGVRGYFTQEVLSALGVNNTIVIGCPSFYENGEKRLIKKKGYSRIACSTIRNKRILSDATRIYLQDEERLIKTVAFYQSECLGIQESLGWIKKKYRVFSNIDEWKKDIATNDFFVGTRVHGAILAINSGVPAVCMNKDSRAREMCEYLDIPYFPHFNSKNKRIEDIYDACDYDEMNKNYAKKYEVYKQFLSDFGIRLLNNMDASVKMPSLSLYGVVPKLFRPWRMIGGGLRKVAHVVDKVGNYFQDCDF